MSALSVMNGGDPESPELWKDKLVKSKSRKILSPTLPPTNLLKAAGGQPTNAGVGSLALVQVSWADMGRVVSEQVKIPQLGSVVSRASVVMECARRVRHLAAMVALTFGSSNLIRQRGLIWTPQGRSQRMWRGVM